MTIKAYTSQPRPSGPPEDDTGWRGFIWYGLPALMFPLILIGGLVLAAIAQK